MRGTLLNSGADVPALLYQSEMKPTGRESGACPMSVLFSSPPFPAFFDLGDCGFWEKMIKWDPL
jgi:hypothetical protein